MTRTELMNIPPSRWIRYTGHIIQTVYGLGDLVKLDDDNWAIRLRLDCVSGCRRIRTIYLRGNMAYEHNGTFIADLRRWEFRCNEHRTI
jgi:hypothetical protein